MIEWREYLFAATMITGTLFFVTGTMVFMKELMKERRIGSKWMLRVSGVILAIALSAGSAAAQDVVPDLRSSRAALPTPMSAQQISDLLNRVAAQHPGWGMLRKDAGNRCPTPYPGISISCDWMVYAPTRWGYDILSDQEGAGAIAESGGSELSPGQEIVYPWPVGGGAPPTQTTPTVPSAPAPAAPLEPMPIKAWIDSAMQTLYDQHERTFANERAEHAVILSQIKEVREKPGAMEQTFTNRYVQIAIAVIGALATEQAVH